MTSGTTSPRSRWLTHVLPGLAVASAMAVSVWAYSGARRPPALHPTEAIGSDGTGLLLLVAIPVVMIAHWILMIRLFARDDYGWAPIPDEFLWVPVAFGLPLHAGVLEMQGGWRMDLNTGLVGAAVLLVAIAGVAMTHSRRNLWFGLRTSRTMASDDAWNRAHRAAGPATAGGGIVALTLVSLLRGDAALVVPLVLVVVTALAAIAIGHRAIRAKPSGE